MKAPSLASIVFSAFLLGVAAVLLLVREPSIALVLLAVGVLGQLVSKLIRARG